MTDPKGAPRATVRELSENSRVQMQAVVNGILAGRSLREIVETTGVPRSRVNRWLSTEDPVFMELLGDSEAQILERLQEELVTEVAASVDRLTAKAIEKLDEAMEAVDKDGKPASRAVTAAAHVMRFAGFGRVARSESPRMPIEGVLTRSGGPGDRGPATGD